MTDVCRATTLEERTPILVWFGIAQQIGLLFGPACNLFLREIDISLFDGSFRVNKLNAPGFFLAVLYLLLEVAVAVLYYDLAKAADEERSVQSELGQQFQGSTQNVSWADYKDEILRGEIVAIIFLRFIALFGQTCLEVSKAPKYSRYPF